jgi:hypothetical protein
MPRREEINFSKYIHYRSLFLVKAVHCNVLSERVNCMYNYDAGFPHINTVAELRCFGGIRDVYSQTSSHGHVDMLYYTCPLVALPVRPGCFVLPANLWTLHR